MPHKVDKEMNENEKTISDLRNDFLEDLSRLNQLTQENDLDEKIAANILDLVESLLSYDYVFLYAEYTDRTMEKIKKAPKLITSLFNNLYLNESDEDLRKFLKERL